MKEVDMISNMYCIYRNEGFIDVKIHYVGGLWVWIEFESEKICETFKSNVSLNSLWSSIIKLKFFDSEADDIMSMGRVSIATKKPSIISDTVSVDGSDSDDSFEENKSHSSYENEDKNEELDDFIEHVVEDKITSKSTNDFHHVEEEVIGSKPKEESAKEVDSNATIPPGFKELGRSGKDNSMARGRSGGLITMWDPSVFSKSRIWCSDNFIIVEGKWMNFAEDYFLINVYGPHHQPDKSNLWDSHRSFIQSHGGNIILFGDMNEVRCESERFGSSFSSSDAAVFNSFIHDVGLKDLPIGGKMFTGMNKIGTKLSKLDCFLISNNTIHAHSNLQVTVHDRVWSDHSPILLHCKKTDFGPIPFKKFHSWFDRKYFDVVVKEAWNSLLVTNVGSTMALHVKVKELKAQLKLWFSRTKVSKVSRKNSILVSLKSLDDKIYTGQATYEDKRLRVNTWHELDNLVNLESMDMFQKARVRWDVEGDENTKFFYGIINSKRNTQMIKGILHEGTWITDPLDIKSAFLNFYKDKFSCHDSLVNFPPMYNRLFRLDRNQDCLISDRIDNGSWSWDWSRPFLSGRTQADLNNILIDISSLDIEVGRDSPIFTLSTDNIFCVSVARKYLDD
ncbi:RNA-directed DNA polymerase, eukaryota, reverse transcriptase zinc-binding domain protein [Tanacetum coccineum]